MSPAVVHCPEDSPRRRKFVDLLRATGKGDLDVTVGSESEPSAGPGFVTTATTTTTTTDTLAFLPTDSSSSSSCGTASLVKRNVWNEDVNSEVVVGGGCCITNVNNSFAGDSKVKVGCCRDNLDKWDNRDNGVLMGTIGIIGKKSCGCVGNGGNPSVSVSVNSECLSKSVDSVDSCSVEGAKGAKEWNFIMKYMTAFTAAATAETVTYPLDLTKTRMQIQGETSAGADILKRSTKFNAGSIGALNAATATRVVDRNSHKIGMLRTAIGICRDEGPLNLWKGILPALYRHVIYSGIRMALYEKLRDDVMGKDANGVFPVWKAAIAGLIVGGFAQFTASPMDLVKVQLQMEGRRKLEGKPPRVRNTQQALLLIYRQGGIKGLWKGWVPNVQRGALVNLGDLTTYDSAKRFLITNCGFDDNVSVHVLSSLMAGFTAALMGTPADVIKTRVMNQPTNERGEGIYYKNSIDCLRKTVGNEGFGALYKGFLPIWMRLGPWSLTFWVTFEWIRTVFGIGGF